ncbi:unnamed protein product [Sphagnum compactum]
MFYSHELLCKKGPLGQIWIAATLRARINRRKAASIDIEEICKQIMHPQVPLALRLSSILMGGVVNVYSRKVNFLYDDLNDFLVKIRTLAALESAAKACSLPRRRYHAKFEKVTIDYGRFSFSEDNIEQPLLRPCTDGAEEEELDPKEKFFVLPRHVDINFEPELHSTARDHLFQGKLGSPYNANIEISGKQSFGYNDLSVGRYEDVSSGSPPDLPQPMDDIFPDFQLPGQRVLSRVHYKLAPNLTGEFLDTIHEEQLPQDTMADDMPQTYPSEEQALYAWSLHVRVQPQGCPKKRRRRVSTKKPAYSKILDGSIEVSAKTFNIWYKDPSDIVSGSLLRKKLKSHQRKVRQAQQAWNVPSVGASLNRIIGLQSSWGHLLTDLWVLTMSRQPHIQMPQECQGNMESGTSVPSQPEMEADFDVQPENSSMEFLRSSLGSVEKLRTALQTPNPDSPLVEDAIRRRIGLTPSLSAGSVEGSGPTFKHPRSTPHKGGLVLDNEGEQPTSGKSKVSRPSLAYRTVSPPDLNDLMEDEFLASQIPSEFPELAEHLVSAGLQGSLTQFELMEDTAGFTQAEVPRGPIGGVTANLLKYMRGHFNKPGASAHESLNSLAAGFERSEAARLFYETCVLASNNFLIVEQTEAYGDIRISRGENL